MSGKKSSYINAQICNITSPLSELSALKLEANAFEIRKKISCLKPFLGMRSASFQVCESRSQSKLIALFAHSNFFFFFFLNYFMSKFVLNFPSRVQKDICLHEEHFSFLSCWDHWESFEKDTQSFKWRLHASLSL